jgi:plastocyanin
MRRVALLLLMVALTLSACGDSEPEAPLTEEAPTVAAQGPVGAGSGTARDDDCVHITRGEFAEIAVLDNLFAPECPLVVSDQILRLRNLGVRVHTFTISENQDDSAPFLLDLTIEGDSVLQTESPLGDFVEPGLYEFFCKYHTGMDGVMQVLEPVRSPPEPKATQPVESSLEVAPKCVDYTQLPTALVTMVDNRFVPDCFTISSEQGLTIRNLGVSLHNLSVDFRKALTGTDLDVDVSSGKMANTNAVGEILEPGSFEVFCKYHLPAMVAELKVR